MNFGGRDVTEWLAGVAELPVTTYADYEAVSQAKEQLCSIGVAPHHVGAEDRRFSMPDGGTVELSAEAAQEVLLIRAFIHPYEPVQLMLSYLKISCYGARCVAFN